MFIDGGVLTGPAAYIIVTAIAGGIIYNGTPIAADIGQWIGNQLWNESTEEGNDTCPVEGTTKGRKTKGRTDQREKEGNFDTANGDFDSLDPTDVRNLPNGGRIGILPDGLRINVRPNSSDGRPTIEIQQGKKKIKIRYGR
nr:hypothetical protein [uncultured Desulfobacter sp.]